MAQLRLKYVNSFRDRHGLMRHYFRRPGVEAVALPSLPGSADFMDAYQAALAGAAPLLDIGASRTKTGTINAAIVGYSAHTSFTKGFAPETQKMRRAILERFRAEHGEKRIALLQRRHIVKLLEAMKPHAQKNWLKTLRGLMAYAVANNLRQDDPTEGVKVVKVGKSIGHMTWHGPQIEQYRPRHLLGTSARLRRELRRNI